jgi:hypothetical protein
MIDETRYPPKYGDRRPLTERVFSSKPEPGLAMRLRKDHPDWYQELRAKAEEAGLVGVRSRDRIAAMFERPARNYSESELVARQIFSEEECRKFYISPSAGSRSNLQRMKTDEPKKYELLRTAAISYGVINPAPEKLEPLPVKTNEPLVELNDELGKRYGFPSGSKVSKATIESMFALDANESIRKSIVNSSEQEKGAE